MDDANYYWTAIYWEIRGKHAGMGRFWTALDANAAYRSSAAWALTTEAQRHGEHQSLILLMPFFNTGTLKLISNPVRRPLNLR